MGGDPTVIPPSLHGYPGTHHKPTHHPGGGHDRPVEHSGKISAVIYDRFGDFAGFDLRTEHGREARYRSHEKEVERLVQNAWSERVFVTVLSDHHDPEVPEGIVFRRFSCE